MHYGASCFLILSLLGLAPAVLGQSTSGSIFGTVLDATGAAVPGATVQAIEISTSITTTTVTSGQGDYLFPALPPGSYRIEVIQPGFKKFVRSGVLLELNRSVKIDVTLAVGEVAEQIEVSSAPPAVETREAQIGGTVDQQRAVDLPLNGRNVYDLALTLPGITTSRTPTIQDNDGNTLNVNGNRQRSSTFLLDGTFNNDLWRNTGNAAPNPEAVDQFRILTSTFSAEYGRSPGAVVNVVTRSGTNEVHGSLFHFLRNDKLNARNYFQPTVNMLRQNQFGLAAGGPLWIPKLYNGRNRTFWFFSWQNILIRQNAFINSGLPPTAAERRGDYSAAPAAQRPVDPNNNQPFPGALIPLSRYDPVSVNIVNRFVPLPNTADGRLEAGESRTNDEPQYVARADHQLNSSHRLYGTMFLVRGKGLDPFASSTQVPRYGVTNTILHQNNGVGGHDWIVSPNMLNQARFGYTQRISRIVSLVRDSWDDFGSKVTFGSLPKRPPQLFITGRWQMGIFGESTFDQTSYNISDTLTWTKGQHTLKMGAWVLLTNFVEAGNWLGSGQVRFQPQFTRNVLADFYLGRAASFRQNNGNDRNFRSNSYQFFFQDDWRVTRRLTLNLGLRYELNEPYVSHRDEVQAFRFDQRSRIFPQAPLGLLFPGDPGIPRGIVQTDRNDWAPRVGFAYDVFGNGKTAVRGGWGIYNSNGFANVTSNAQGQPWLVDITVFGTPSLVDPWSATPGGSPYPVQFDPANPRFTTPATVSNFAPGFRNPYVFQYSFTVEQQVEANTAVSAAYVANSARKLPYMRDYNAPVFGPGATAGNVNQRRPYLPGTFAQVGLIESGANSSYNSLQLSVNRRFTRTLTLIGNYTWAKSLDEASIDITGPSAVTLVDNRSRTIERAVANFDIRHVANISGVWDLPSLSGAHALLKAAAGGWKLGGILRFQSGSPVNLTIGRDTNLDGNANDRPDLIGDLKVKSGASRAEMIAGYYDPAATAAAAPGMIGTLGRNAIYGPGFRQWDVSLMKHFNLWENHKLQLRAEAFNFPNWVNLSNPVANVSAPNAGRIIGAGAARQVQFALKYIF